MVAKRQAGGGRKPKVIPNPFVIQDIWGDPINILWDMEHELDIRIEDTLIGCVRAFHAERPPSAKQEFVNWQKLLRVYRNCDTLTRKSIQDYLMCSESQAKRYIQVIKLVNPFIERCIKGMSGSKVKGYTDVTPNQVKAGYLTIL